MSGKYFVYMAIIIFLAAIFLPAVLLRWHWRLKYLQNLVRINVLKRQQKSERETFFSTYLLNRCCRILYFKPCPQAQMALSKLVAGHPENAAAYLETLDRQLALLLYAHTDLSAAYKKMLKNKGEWLNNSRYNVFFPLIAHLSHDRKTLNNALSKLETSPLPHRSCVLAAYRNLALSFAYSYEGEMLSASQTASAALKIFQKKQYAMETAACHLILADIYRISCVNDIAETMIDSAVKIYQTQKTPLFLARATVIKGMLMVFENRRETATELYQKALQMPITDRLRADIYNQQALLKIIEGKPAAAVKDLNSALDIHQRQQNRHSTALSLQLLAQTAYLQKHYRSTVKYAEQARKIYALTQNHSAYAECLYLAASAQYRQNSLAQAENNLRDILKWTRHISCNFHVANVYNLLGIIYMQKGDLQRAKVLFQQSLHLEQSCQRNEGLAADYFNLALIETLTDHPEDAAHNRHIAEEYAAQTGDTELLDLVKQTPVN